MKFVAQLLLFLLMGSTAMGKIPNFGRLRIIPSTSIPERSQYKDVGAIAEARTTMREYFECRSHFNEKLRNADKNLLACLELVISPKLPDAIRRDYAKMLTYTLTISEPHVCTIEEERLARRLYNAPPALLCFETFMNGEKDHGYFGFERYQNRMVIRKIHLAVVEAAAVPSKK